MISLLYQFILYGTVMMLYYRATTSFRLHFLSYYFLFFFCHFANMNRLNGWSNPIQSNSVLFVIYINWLWLDHLCHELRKINYIHILWCATFESLSFVSINFRCIVVCSHDTHIYSSPFEVCVFIKFHLKYASQFNALASFELNKDPRKCFLDPRHQYKAFVPYWLFWHMI